MNAVQPPNQSQRTSGLAITSLILSCATVILGPFGCIPGIICGHIARSECRKNPNLSGDGMALAGLMIGYIFLGLGILALLLLVSVVPMAVADTSTSTLTVCALDLVTSASDGRRYVPGQKDDRTGTRPGPEKGRMTIT